MPYHLNKNLTKEFVADALNQNLPGEKAHQIMKPNGRSLLIPENEKQVKKSAILILIYPDENELKFCLTKRNEQLKHHPGQISFPGGKCESHESEPITTALRETEEEIGIHFSKIEILGELSTLYVPVSKFKIYPFIGWTNQKPNFKINQFEVDEIITLPLKSILDNNYKAIKTVKTSWGKTKVPCYFIENNLIWGATSMMIAELEVILKQHYSHREAHLNNDDICQ